MSHQVLARKWRPSKFSEMVGQQHVLKALANGLETGRLHHAYLFSGTRGVGKTTVARILAKCLNCKVGITSTPCGQCGICVEIAEGRSVDLIEVDAASKTGVDDMRELLENVQYAPTLARYKIYLIDEVHMLSKNSFAALLKTLEEPPPHSIFLLATTDPRKLPATVLSRCLQFNLKNMQPEQIIEHLVNVLDAETVDYDSEALALIARAADGSMRDALSLTDQAIAYGQGHLGSVEVREMLGTVDRGRILGLVTSILDDDPSAVLSQLASLAEHASDFVSVLDELSAIFHQMTIAQTVPDAFEASWSDQAKIVELAARATIDDTQFFWQVAVAGRRDINLASSARTGLEMLLLRMIAFRPAVVIQPELVRGELPEKKPEPPAYPVERPDGSETTELGDKNEGREGIKTSALTETAPKLETNRTSLIVDANGQHPPASLSACVSSSCADYGSTLTPEEWPEVFESLEMKGILYNIALNLEFVGLSGSEFNFAISSEDATLLNEQHQRQLSQVLSRHLGRDVDAKIEIIRHCRLTPANRRSAIAAAKLVEIEQAVSSDNRLHAFLRAFDGEIIPDSIRASEDEE